MYIMWSIYFSFSCSHFLWISFCISPHEPLADVRPSFSVWSPFATQRSPGAATCRVTHGILKKNSRPPWVGMSCLPVSQC